MTGAADIQDRRSRQILLHKIAVRAMDGAKVVIEMALES